jgi:hypothetical protein
MDEVFPDLSKLSDAELRTMIHELEVQEDDISMRRRVLQGRIDILRAHAGAEDVDRLAEVLAGLLVETEGEALSEEVKELKTEEEEISRERKLLHGRIDLLRAALTIRLRNKGETELLKEVDVDKLTEILTRKSTPPTD